MEGLLDDLLRDDAAAAAPRSRRTALLLVVALVAGAGLAWGGWTGTSWLRDRDLRSALAASTSVVTTVVAQAESAPDVRSLVGVVEGLPTAQDAVARARDRAGRGSGERARDVQAVLQAHAAVLAALEPLGGLGSGPLQAWGRLRGPLQEALDDEARARQRVDRPEEVRRLAVLDRLAPALDALAEPLLTRAATGELRRLAGVLQGARSTADLRSAAELAQAQRPFVRVTADVAPGSAAPAVARCAEVLAALSGLTRLSGEDLGAWDLVRPRLAADLGAPEAVASVDRLVEAGRAAVQQWRESVSASTSAREAEALAVEQHARTVRGLASSYPALDDALAALLAELVLRPVGPADLDALASDVGARTRLVDALAAQAAPLSLATQHAVVVATARAEVTAVQSLAEALAAGLAPDLLAEPVLRRSDAADARRAALTRWDADAVRTLALVAKRPLPEPPVV